MDTLDLYIYDYIGTWDDEVSAQDVVRLLAEHSQVDTVRLFVNSGGGDVYEGLAIHSALARHGARIEALVEGVAASIASCIVQAGDERLIAPTAQMMIHDPTGGAWGDAEDLEAVMRQLVTARQTLADLYFARSGQGDVQAWLDAMAATTWYTADEAVAAGLCDAVAAPAIAPVFARQPRLAAARPAARLGARPPARRVIVPGIHASTNPPPTTMAKTLAERLKAAFGLKAEATEEEIAAAAEAAAAAAADDPAPDPTPDPTATPAPTSPAPTSPAASLPADAPQWARDLQASNAGLQAKLDAAEAAERERVITAAVEDGRILEAERADWTRRLTSDPVAEGRALAALSPLRRSPSARRVKAPEASSPGAADKPKTRAEIRAAAKERAKQDSQFDIRKAD